MGLFSWHFDWAIVPMRLSGRQSLGQWRFGASGLARGKAICKSSRFVAGGATRSEALLREALPCLWRRTRTDPIPARTCFCPNDGKIPRMQAAHSRSCERPHRYRAGAQFRRLGPRRRLYVKDGVVLGVPPRGVIRDASLFRGLLFALPATR
jgi:hypothetical protein